MGAGRVGTAPPLLELELELLELLELEPLELELLEPVEPELLELLEAAAAPAAGSGGTKRRDFADTLGVPLRFAAIRVGFANGGSTGIAGRAEGLRLNDALAARAAPAQLLLELLEELLLELLEELLFDVPAAQSSETSPTHWASHFVLQQYESAHRQRPYRRRRRN